MPQESQLHGFVKAGDFLDCYVTASDRAVREAAELAMKFPWWVRALLSLRNLLVRPFGLSTDGPEVADKIGLFPVQSETESEIIAGFNDKHLNFRLAILAQSGQIFLATWVHPHNVGGRLYLGVVLPFHVIIIRNALAKCHRAP